MAENLVIVESPAKAKTIEKYLGKDYIVRSSFGHIRDLAKKNYGIDINNDFEPQYEIDPEKKKLVSDLKKDVKNSKTVWLASDEDREGEAIAWHLYEVLSLTNNNSKRIVFNEITKNAITKAIQNPRQIDLNLVNAQQARRILDRLVGFELSEVLWKKVKSQLSAGRVQSVAVRLIVEREREINIFVPTCNYKITAIFLVTDASGKTTELKAELNTRFNDTEQATNFIERCKTATFSIEKIETKPTKKSASAPFTTSTLQQEASRKLGYSVAQTMTVAQNLYEEGKITYMRTDSVNLSEEALNNIKNYVVDTYGEKYSKPTQYKTKSKGAQEAHEAIRPTTMSAHVSSDRQEQKLYELIFNRAIASQMADAIFEKTSVTIKTDKHTEKFLAIGEVLKFEGFLKAYGYQNQDEDTEDEENIVILPPLKETQILTYKNIKATEKYTTPAARYTEASLVRKLEELGIGRPSTYAPTISTIQKRGYVIKEDRAGQVRTIKEITLENGKLKTAQKKETFNNEKKKLFPTDIGTVVNDFLVENFEKILEYNFTANVEKDFDEIAEGKLVWNKMLAKFYKDFHKSIELTLQNAERKTGERELGIDPLTNKKVITRIAKFGPVVQLGDSEEDKPKYVSLRKDQSIETITLDEALELLNSDNNGKLLGTDPQTGKPIYVRFGKFGPMVQRGSQDDTNKPEYAGLLKGQTMNTLTLEQALSLLKLPREIGDFENKNVTVAIGKFGPYIKHDNKFTSLKKTDDPLTVTLERAIELIIEKRDTDSNKIIKEYPENPDIRIIYDRWKKPTIFYKKNYYKVPKEQDPTTLSLADCLKIIQDLEKK